MSFSYMNYFVTLFSEVINLDMWRSMFFKAHGTSLPLAINIDKQAERSKNP